VTSLVAETVCCVLDVPMITGDGVSLFVVNKAKAFEEIV
jgi:hypothetical protein